MTKFDPHPPLFQPRVGKNFDPLTYSLYLHLQKISPPSLFSRPPHLQKISTPLPLLSTPPPTKNLDPHLHFDNSITASNHFGCPPLYLLQCINVLLQVWTPSLYTILQMRPHQRFIQPKYNILLHADYRPLDHSHSICPLCCFHALSRWFRTAVHNNS